jgi:hypothetical protein
MTTADHHLEQRRAGGSLAGAAFSRWGLLLLGLAGGCSVDDRVVRAPIGSSGGQGGSSGATDTTVVQSSGGTTGAGIGGAAGEAPPVARVTPNQLDLLFMIDNSRSMSDKQEVLRAAIPDLMSRLVNPICLDAAGNEFPAPPPGAECPGEQHRQFEPIADIHIGILSSSLGDIGANAACPAPDLPGFRPDLVDMGHLIGSLPRGQMANANANGFLEWRQGSNLDLINSSFQAMVSAVGESGCGWEASLEAWYRFLIDPKPYRGLTHVPCDAQATTNDCLAPALDGTGQAQLDETVLAQRAAFLRPNSLVAVIMLTDENDCSLQPDGTNWLVVDIISSAPMYRGSSACDTNPNDECCRSCASPAPANCPAEPGCDGPARLPSLADGRNLRCFDQKRRFGYDFLYPTQRYVNALTLPQLCLEQPDLSLGGCPSAPAQNPLFSSGRTPDQVLLAGIVGVPWQAISAGTGQNGQPLSSPDRQLRFKSSGELSDADWNRIAGSPGTPWRAAMGSVPEQLATLPVPPSEPTMVESAAVRPNVSSGNPINGRDFDTGQTEGGPGAPDDLEYACIFPLLTPRDCAQRSRANGDSCDCYTGTLDRPLCEVTPGNGTPGTTQYWAKAYPGLRQLQVLRELGQSSVASSICARNTADPSRPDYGYRPAMSAIIEGLQPQLARR